MAEYIKRETVINHLDACMDTIWKPEIVALKCFVEGIPAADVAPVVHCRECKHHVAGYCCRDINGRTNMFRMFDNDFCSYGERRADEQ